MARDGELVLPVSAHNLSVAKNNLSRHAHHGSLKRFRATGVELGGAIGAQQKYVGHTLFPGRNQLAVGDGQAGEVFGLTADRVATGGEEVHVYGNCQLVPAEERGGRLAAGFQWGVTVVGREDGPDRAVAEVDADSQAPLKLA